MKNILKNFHPYYSLPENWKTGISYLVFALIMIGAALLIVLAIALLMLYATSSGTDYYLKAADRDLEATAYLRIDRALTRLEHAVDEKLARDAAQLAAAETRRGFATGRASHYDYALPGHPDYSKVNMTAASRDFPRGAKVQVCLAIELYTEPPCVNVVINDYGPSAAVHPDRIIDLSSAAFVKLAPLGRGIVPVRVERIN